MNLRKLTDTELLDTAKTLVGKERKILVNLLWYLAEIENRKLYLKLGYSSMYRLLTKKLKFSEGAAMRRLNSARLMAKFPRDRSYVS